MTFTVILQAAGGSSMLSTLVPMVLIMVVKVVKRGLKYKYNL